MERPLSEDDVYTGTRDIETLSNSPTLQDHDVKDDGRVDLEIDPETSKQWNKLLAVQNDKSQLPEPSTTPFNPALTDIPKLNVLIQAIGSRGDVQPFIALGHELRRYGHRVRIATHDVFRDFVQGSGLEFFPVGGDPEELMAHMVKNPGLIPDMRSLRVSDIQSKRKMIASMLNGFWDSCIKPDPSTDEPFVAEAIVANPPSYAHVHCAQALGVPLHIMFTMPWTSTRAFPHPLANLKQADAEGPSAAKHLSYGLVEFLTWRGLGDLVNRWREQTLSLEPIATSEGYRLLESLGIPFAYIFSSALIPKPADWGPNIDICGFVFRETPQYTPSPELQKFLNIGPQPIYIGFGSIVVHDAERIATIICQAVRTLGVRAIISKGWSDLGSHADATSDPNIFYVGDCPHEWLFPQVSVVVHHGGAGTTACGLSCGKPTVIVPFFGDQPFWGHVIKAAGAGPEPVPYSSLTTRRLADAISDAQSPEVAAAALQLSDRISMEQGAKRAVEAFHRHLPQSKMQCELYPGEPASWAFKGKHRSVLLSKKAAAILEARGQVERKKLKLYETKPLAIDTQRWDPITAVSAASISTLVDMSQATARLVYDPLSEATRAGSRRRGSPIPSEEDLNGSSKPQDASAIMQPLGESPPYGASPTPPTRPDVTQKQITSSKTAQSAEKLVTSAAKGVLVTIPLAATEGLRSVPRLYGEEVKQHEHVRDFRSGITVAGKEFVSGIAGAATDIVTYTYKGKRDEGPAGVAKGLAKGFLGMAAKTGAAAGGLLAYPAQGLYRGIRASVRSSTRESIEQAKRGEGEWLVKKDNVVSEREIEAIMADFESLRRS